MGVMRARACGVKWGGCAKWFEGGGGGGNRCVGRDARKAAGTRRGCGGGGASARVRGRLGARGGKVGRVDMGGLRHRRLSECCVV